MADNFPSGMVFRPDDDPRFDEKSAPLTLLPCPFCGGEADPESWQYIHGRYEGRIQCIVCKATAPDFAAWNDRVENRGLIEARAKIHALREGIGAFHNHELASALAHLEEATDTVCKRLRAHTRALLTTTPTDGSRG